MGFRKFALLVAFFALEGCGQGPAGICEMPANKHFWQGIQVDWSGEIMDLAPPSVTAFTDWRCGTAIEIDERAGPLLFNKTGELDAYAAVASYRIQGRLAFRNGEIVLVPDKLIRTSEWKTGASLERYAEKRAASLQSSLGRK